MQELVDLKQENKKKGEHREARYAGKGAWIVNDAKDLAIISPYSVVLRHLEDLGYLPYEYLKMPNAIMSSLSNITECQLEQLFEMRQNANKRPLFGSLKFSMRLKKRQSE